MAPSCATVGPVETVYLVVLIAAAAGMTLAALVALARLLADERP